MMRSRSTWVFALTTLGVSSSWAEVRLSPIFQSGMVLQQGRNTQIFGTGNPGEHVWIDLSGSKAEAIAGSDGRWFVGVRTPKAGGPYTLAIRDAAGKTQRLTDVLVGEVWFCSGQSNMEWEANWFNGRRFEIGDTNFPNLRMFKHTKRVSANPRYDALGTWEKPNAENTRAFSLVGFLFARQLHQKLNVPVGIICSAWGGTPAESWIDMPGLSGRPELASLVQKYQQSANPGSDVLRQYQQAVEAWRTVAFDPGSRISWAGPTVEEPVAWRDIDLPAAFETKGVTYDGVTWVRKTVDIPATLAGKDLTLELGPIDDFDTTYFNGEKVGQTGPEVANAYAAPRKYTVPGALVKAGPNVIAIRVIDTGGGGGLTGPGPMRIGDGETFVSLAGTWSYRIAIDFVDPEQLKRFTAPTPPVGMDDPWLPTSLFNGMVASVAPYSMKGAIWYQGESNVGRAAEYSVLFPEMIRAWRRVWNDPNLAFNFVQLASYNTPGDSTTDSSWAELRESQTDALKLPNVGMAVAIDIGEQNDIHPFKKGEVADRLARVALVKSYGKRVESMGPTLRGFKLLDGAIRLRFTHAKGLKTNDGGPVRGFAIAGIDGKYFPAEVTIDREELVLRNPNVKRPVSVRYGWADFSPANLVNGEGLGAPPFRTDRPAALPKP